MKTNNNSVIYDFVVIGGGPVGIYCATELSKKKYKTLLIESTNNLGGLPINMYKNKIIYDYPKFDKIKSSDLINQFIDDLNKTNCDIKLNTTIVSNKNNELITSTNEAIKYKNIALAIGNGIAKPLLFNNIKESNFINYSINDINKYKNTNVVILGGGDSAVDYANEISHVAKATTIIHRRNEFRAEQNSIDLMKKNNINILTNEIVKEINENNKNIILDSNKIINYDYLLICFGIIFDNKHFLSVFNKLKINENNKVIVNTNTMKTNINNIYAVGDVCYYENKKLRIWNGIEEVNKMISNLD